MMLALESSVKTRKEESHAEYDTHEVMKSSRIRHIFDYFYFRMIEQTQGNQKDHFLKETLLRQSTRQGGWSRFTHMSAFQVLRGSALKCGDRSPSLLMKPSFNHDCMQHATPERVQASVCLLGLLLPLIFCNECTLLHSEFYRLRSNDAAVSTSMEEMLHCAHAASDDSIFLKIKHFEHDLGLKGTVQAWTKHSSMLFWGPYVLLHWKIGESMVRCCWK